jgi:hypothetical protein
MLTTMELRWFYRGTIPPAIAQWFQQPELGEFLEASSQREDTYLLLPGHDYLGLKLRQGTLEVKLRQAELGVQDFDIGWQGRVEQWVKWSADSSPPVEAMSEASTAQGTWISVQKARSQRQYEVLPNQTCVAVPLAQATATRCTMELTQLTVNTTDRNTIDWWSLAFEATGDRAFSGLKTVVNWVSRTQYPMPPREEDSFAYPHWLLKAVKPANSLNKDSKE